MRIVFVGAGTTALSTARMLLRLGHEVVFIEQNKDLVESLSKEMDCGFLAGDGSVPAILREANPTQTDFLFCMTGNDQVNIIASLVGRSLEFRRVVTKIENPEFEHVCIELGLEDTIIPHRTISRFLTGMVRGHDPLEISAMFKDNTRFFSFVARAQDAQPVGELPLPKRSRVICLYRNQELMITDAESKLVEGDQVVVLTHSDDYATVAAHWQSGI